MKTNDEISDLEILVLFVWLLVVGAISAVLIYGLTHVSPHELQMFNFNITGLAWMSAFGSFMVLWTGDRRK